MGPTQNRPKRHHHVPEFYLRGFADPKGRVQVHDRVTGQSFVTGVRNVAVEAGFYDLVADDGTKLPDAEEALGDLEGQAAAILESIRRSEPPAPALSDEDRAILAVFLAIQFVRTPEQRIEQKALSDFFFRMELDLNYQALGPEGFEGYIQEQMEGKATPDIIKAVTNFAANIDKHRIEPHQNQLVMQMFELAHEFAPLFGIRPWVLLRRHKPSFITSDRPVTLWRRRTKSNRPYGVGVATADEVYFAIDPRNVLVLLPGPEESWSWETASSERVRHINRTIAHWCGRRIFHHPRHRPLQGDSISKEGPTLHINGVPIRNDTDAWNQLRKGFIDGNVVPVVHTAHGVDPFKK